jgi:hypothetical protein
MDADDLARIAHYRRWLSPDWRRWLHPDWERFVHPAQRAAMRKDFALRDRAFETPLARRWREEREEQERLEAEHQAEIAREALEIKAELAALRVELAMRRKAWEAECAERKLRADIAWERFKAAFMRGDFAPRRKANFNPNQARVAAGNPDGGQWTSDGGAPGVQLAQNETQRRFSVDLNEEEARGGHTLSNHVGKTDDELLAKVRGDRGSVGIVSYARKREGTFESRESANDFVNRTLEQNQGTVDQVADGKLNRAFLNTRFGYPTGREAFRPSIDSEPYLRDTYEVGVEIRRDPRIGRGYRVHTAYPMNQAP